MISLQEIKDVSPRYEYCCDPETGEKNIQMAFYSISCCWWTSFAEDLGHTEPAQTIRNGKPIGKLNSLPCCPNCGSLLLQAPLLKFLKAAEENPGHYGEKGLNALLTAHHRNSMICYQKWEQY